MQIGALRSAQMNPTMRLNDNTSAAGFLPNVNPYSVTETTALNHSLRIKLTKIYSPWSPPLNGQNVMKYQAHKSELYGGWCNTCQCMGRRWSVVATWRWALSCSSTCLSRSQLLMLIRRYLWVTQELYVCRMVSGSFWLQNRVRRRRLGRSCAVVPVTGQ
jgi:hypothetical protein